MIDLDRLKGPVAPVLTPFKTDLSLDVRGLGRNVAGMVERGMGKEAGFLLAVGAGGEFPSLSDEERMRVAETIVKKAAGRLPVFVGVQHTNSLAAIALAKHAKRIGADGVQASPPLYYHPTASDVYNHFKAINDSVKLPIMVYNTFWEGYNIDTELLGKLIELENVVCIKWSSPSMHEFKKGFRLYRGKAVFIDNSASPILSHVLGARGFISHEANFWPEHELELFSSIEARDYSAAAKMIDTLNWPFYDFRVKIGSRKGGEAHVIKAALDIAGLAGGPTRPPTASLDDAEREELKSLLSEAGLPNLRPK
jgi:4-hydroxy-tetrahydrodipicolinate synthase